MNSALMPVTLKLTTSEYEMLWERAEDGDVTDYLLRRIRRSLGNREPGEDDDRPRTASRVEEDGELAAMRRAGFRLMPRSISPVREYHRRRSCFVCDCAGRPKDWRTRGRFADYQILDENVQPTDRAATRAICEEHARKYGA